MRNTGRGSHLILIVLVVLFVAGRDARATRIVFDQLNASLDTGSLAGTHFPVSFSYDADQVNPVGDSFISLNSFDFTLLGVPFTRSDIFQGGQVIFHDGILENVTASFQVFLPPHSPVTNITFGFGGPGIIGYIDLNHQFGTGTFTFASATVPEPAPIKVFALALFLLASLHTRELRKARRRRSMLD